MYKNELLEYAAKMRTKPGFPAALIEYTLGLARTRRAPRIINRIASTCKRLRVCAYLLFLYADQETYGLQGGATYKNLYHLCVRREEVSPRILKNTLALMNLTGFVKTVPSTADRRIKYYMPTDRMIEFVREWMSYATQALDHVEPEAQRSHKLLADPDFMWHFLLWGGRDHAVNTPLTDFMPEFIEFFGVRDGAPVIVVMSMIADLGIASWPGQRAIAREYGLSKTQVASLIAEGVDRGFFTISPKEIPVPTAHLRDSYREWASIELSFYARHMPVRSPSDGFSTKEKDHSFKLPTMQMT